MDLPPSPPRSRRVPARTRASDRRWNRRRRRRAHPGHSRSLAKGLAAGAIELIMLLTFKVGSAALKGAKAAAKGVATGARALARGTANIVRRGVGSVVKGGKVLLRGASRGIARGAKRLRDLGTRLLSRTRFKGFRIRIANRRFKLEGA